MLNPENPVKNKNEVKTDATLPAYCNPPNPCPVGYTGKYYTFIVYKSCMTVIRLKYIMFENMHGCVSLAGRERKAIQIVTVLF